MNLLLSFICLFFMGETFIPRDAPMRDPDVENVKRATRLVKAGEFDEAEGIFREIVKTIHFNITTPNYALRDPLTAARNACFAAWQKQPDVLWLRDVVLEFALDIASAREHAETFLREDGNHAHSNYVMGSLYLYNEQHEAAEPYLKKSVDAAPRGFNNYAETLRRLGRAVEAEPYARRAVEFAEAEGFRYYACAAYDTLAMTLVDQEKFAEALEPYGMSLKIGREVSQHSHVLFWMTGLHIYVGLRDVERARHHRDFIAGYVHQLNAEERETFIRLSDRLEALLIETENEAPPVVE